MKFSQFIDENAIAGLTDCSQQSVSGMMKRRLELGLPGGVLTGDEREKIERKYNRLKRIVRGLQICFGLLFACAAVFIVLQDKTLLLAPALPFLLVLTPIAKRANKWAFKQKYSIAAALLVFSPMALSSLLLLCLIDQSKKMWGLAAWILVSWSVLLLVAVLVQPRTRD